MRILLQKSGGLPLAENAFYSIKTTLFVY